MLLKFISKKSASSYFYFITAIFSVTIIAASLLFLAKDYSNFKANASYEVKAQNNNIRQKVTDSLLYTKQIMSYVGKQISNRNPRDYEFINKLLMNYRSPQGGLLYWNIFAWVDTEKNLRVSSGMGVLDEKIDLSDRDYVLLSRDSVEVMHVGKPIIGKLSKMYIVPISYGITNSHREYVGSLVAGLVVDNIESEINKVISDENILFALITKDGEVVTKSTRIDSGKNKKVFDEIIGNIRKNPNREVSSDFAYYQRVFECSSLECNNYGIVTIYDQSTTSHRSTTRLIVYLLIASFAISIGGFMLFGFYENIIHPIAVLSEISKKIREGTQDDQFPKFEVHELDQLANSLKEIDKALWNKRDK
jgi:hypothetical protein